MKYIVISLIMLSFFYSCKKNKKQIDTQASNNKLEYAKLFSISQNNAYCLITVKNPWDTTENIATYVLIHQDSLIPENIPEGIIVRTPVKKVAAYSAIDVGVMQIINEEDKIKAVCEPQYIKLPSFEKRVSNGDIIDLGMSSKPNIEKILASKCDILFTNPNKNSNYETIMQTGIKVIQSINYMEKKPLGRSEWIKFYAAFFNKEKLADSIFNEIKNRYNNIKAIAAKNNTHRKTILTEKKYGQTWWVSAGNSFAAELYHDANAKYIWEDNTENGSIGLSFEEVYLKAAKADFWFIRYFKESGDLTLKELQNEYNSYALFDAFKNKKVYGCNTAKSSYYSLASTQPDIELKDIATILYSELFENKETTYYKQLK